MAHFYGEVRGARGAVHRLGHKSGGLTVTAASWQGAIEVNLRHDKSTGRDVVEIRFRQWQGAGTNKPLFSGPVDGSTVPERRRTVRV